MNTGNIIRRVGFAWKMLSLSLLAVCVCALHQCVHCELEAFSIVDKPTTRSSVYQLPAQAKTFHANLAVDGRLDTYAQSEFGDQHPWWRMDMGSVYNLSKITVQLRIDCCGQRFTGAVVRAGVNSDYNKNQQCGSPATRAQSVTKDVIEFQCHPPVTAKYVSLDIDPARVGVTEAVLQLAEVTAELDDAASKSVVVGSLVSQSSTRGYYQAHLAVDGNLSSFFHSDGSDPQPWWQVDFGEEHCMGRVSATLRWNCCGYRFTGAVVRAGVKPDYTENQQCGSPATLTQSVQGAVVGFLCDPPVMARYVSVDIDPSRPGVTQAILQLAEVNVEEYTSQECAGISAQTTRKRATTQEMTCYVI